jgi:CRP/FNR family transcriptional regulator, cyclic AMP receptor protein
MENMTQASAEKTGFSDLLCEMGEAIGVGRGETIYYPGTPSNSVYMVEEGRVTLSYLDESGKKLTLSILDPAEIFGEMCLVGEKFRRYLASAIEDSVIRRVGRKEFAAAINMDPGYLQLMLRHFGRRVREFEEALEDFAFKDIQARLSRQLLKLSDEYGVKTKEGTLIGFQLTHKDLADMIGSARENTTLALNRFAREGILDKSRYRIVIKDEESLREKCGMRN